MIIAVDFDGTMADHRYPDIGPAVPGAIEWMKKWQELGAKIVLWTMRSDSESQGPVLTKAIEWVESRGVQLWGRNENPEQSTWSHSPKAYAHVYVDDAAFGCPLIRPIGFKRVCVDWNIVGPAIEEQIKLKG